MKILILLLLSFNVAAEECIGGYELMAQRFDDFERLVDMHEHAGDHPEAKKHSCRAKIKTNTIIERINSRSSRKVNKTVNGVSFRNEDIHLINIYEKLLTEDKIIRPTRYTLNTECTKVLCAVKQAFGEDLGPRLVYLMDRYGLNGSEYQTENADRWTVEELDPLIQGLEDLPPGMLPIDDNKPFYRFKRGYTYSRYNEEGICVRANSRMIFFGCMFDDEPGFDDTATTLHEIAHYIGKEFDFDGAGWMELSGWDESVTFELEAAKFEYSHDPNACFISTYGMETPGEDFAESFVAYRYTPERLKNTCPQKYEYLKNNVFNGVEFINHKQFCRERPEVVYPEGSGIIDFFRNIFENF